MKEDYTEGLYKAYKYLHTHDFKNEAEKVWADENMYNHLQELSKEELEAEIALLDKYIRFLKLQYFYIFEDEDTTEESVAFTPKDIYRLWLEKDMAIYDVIEECTDEYIQDVIEYWVARQYDYDAIEMLAKYKSMRASFRSK